jgi:hypothetical protein
MVLADSPLACIRMTKAAFFLSSALGRPMCCPRARRASRAAVRRSRPSSSSSSARLARTPATIRPVALEVSIPSRNDRRTIFRYHLGVRPAVGGMPVQPDQLHGTRGVSGKQPCRHPGLAL